MNIDYSITEINVSVDGWATKLDFQEVSPKHFRLYSVTVSNTIGSVSEMFQLVANGICTIYIYIYYIYNYVCLSIYIIHVSYSFIRFGEDGAVVIYGT